MPEDGHVTMNIFIRGSLIEDRPVDRFQPAGEYTLEWPTPADGPELFVSIEVGDHRDWTRFERASLRD